MEQDGGRDERAEQERKAWAAYEAIVDQEAEATRVMRTAREVLEGIQRQKAAAQDLLDRAMAVRNRVDLASKDEGDEGRETERVLRHSLAPRIVSSD